jgi:hypothetical protein
LLADSGLGDAKLKARFADLAGMTLAGSPADFGKLIADETEKWGNVIRTARTSSHKQWTCDRRRASDRRSPMTLRRIPCWRLRLSGAVAAIASVALVAVCVGPITPASMWGIGQFAIRGGSAVCVRTLPSSSGGLQSLRPWPDLLRRDLCTENATAGAASGGAGAGRHPESGSGTDSERRLAAGQSGRSRGHW